MYGGGESLEEPMVLVVKKAEEGSDKEGWCYLRTSNQVCWAAEADRPSGHRLGIGGEHVRRRWRGIAVCRIVS